MPSEKTDRVPGRPPRDVPETGPDDERTDDRRAHDEDCLDESLDETFPASDPIAPQSPKAAP